MCIIERSLKLDSSDDAEAYLTIDDNREKAIRVTRGTFGGLRTNTAYYSSLPKDDNGYYLGIYDYNVFFPSDTVARRVYLPEEPLDGQEYWIETAGTDVIIESKNYPMWVHYLKGKTYRVNLTAIGVTRFKFYRDALALGEADEINGIWTVSILESRT